MVITQTIIHYFLHFIFPIILAFLFAKPHWKRIYGIMLLTMLVDADHLIANPIFAACRCSIGFHPLHTMPAIALYFFALLFPKLRWIAIGLLLHMATDYIDCLFTAINCK